MRIDKMKKRILIPIISVAAVAVVSLSIVLPIVLIEENKVEEIRSGFDEGRSCLPINIIYDWHTAAKTNTKKETKKNIDVYFGPDFTVPDRVKFSPESDLSQTLNLKLIRNVYNENGIFDKYLISSTVIYTISNSIASFIKGRFYSEYSHFKDTVDANDLNNKEGSITYSFILKPKDDEEIKLYEPGDEEKESMYGEKITEMVHASFKFSVDWKKRIKFKNFD